jgi:hypothetical protein
MGSSLTSSGSVPVLRCLMLFDDINYRDWVPRMRLHMHGFRPWDFLMGELPCPPHPSPPAEPVILEKATTTEKEKLLTNFEDRLASYKT